MAAKSSGLLVPQLSDTPSTAPCWSPFCAGGDRYQKLLWGLVHTDKGLSVAVRILSAQSANFEPVDLAFAWISDRSAPLILGQTNFFQMFDVCFYRAELVFEVSTRLN
jgi:hypothetical protein